jgi:hypothetical protein
MSKIDRITALRAKLDTLEENAKRLRSESSTLCAFTPGPDGQPITEISDPDRFASIGSELVAIRVQREAITTALRDVETLIGPGSLADIESESRHNIDKAQRLRTDYFQKFHNIAVRRPHGWLTPEETLATEEYTRLKAEYEPEILGYEARATQADSLADKVSMIIRGI